MSHSVLGEHALSYSRYDQLDVEEPLCRPSSAYTSKPAVHFKIPLSSEFTPPPSPPRQPSPLAGTRFAPLLSRATSAIRRGSPSPEREVRSDSGSGTNQEDASSKRKKTSQAIPAFVNLFQGNSVPMEIGFFQSPKKEEAPKDSPFPSGPSRPGHVRRISALQNAANFLGFPPKYPNRPTPRNEQADIEEYSDEEDEEEAVIEEDSLFNLDLENELLPMGMPDRVSQASFDDLYSNAMQLLVRMQAAYKDKCLALEKATAVKDVEKDELDEAHTRASHLKLQLDGMSAKVAEQDEAMKSLVDELASEKHQRQLEKDERMQTIRLVDDVIVSQGHSGYRIFSGGSELSDVNLDEASDSERDSDSDDDNDDDESVMSSRPSSSSGASVSTTQDGSPAVPVYQLPGSNHLTPSTMSSAQRENMRLKARVAELEETVESCLGLVSGIGI